MNSTNRIAFATAIDDGLALGDPTGAHVVLNPQGVEYWSIGATAPHAVYRWGDVRSIEIEARASRSRRPGGVSVLLGAAADAVGLSWLPGVAPVTVTVEADGGRRDLECDGYIGPGYWSPHLDVLRAATDVLLALPPTRAVLADPTRVLADLSAAADEPREARVRLGRAWG